MIVIHLNALFFIFNISNHNKKPTKSSNFIFLPLRTKPSNLFIHFLMPLRLDIIDKEQNYKVICVYIYNFILMGKGKNNEDESEDYSDQQQDQKLQIRKPKIERIDKFKNLKKIVINLSMTQYPVVADVAQSLGWKIQYNNDAGDWDVYWTDFSIDAEILIKMHLFQKINYFPGIYTIARKNLLGMHLMSLKNKFPDQYNFFPLTWMLPLQYAEFRAYYQSKPKGKTRTYIIKPEAECQGRGIFLTRKIQDLQNGKHYVVQRYVARPYLIDGLKFDLRIYVLLCGTNPMRIYMYNEGLARLATEQYVQPNSSNLQKQYVHLTNYAINKNNPKFIFNNSSNNMGIGHKRSLTSVYKLFAARGLNVQELKEKINDITIKTIACALPLISHQYKCSQPEDYSGNICFHILGLDIMLNNKAQPVLIEVNHTPSFATDTPLDHKIKFNLIKDTFKLMNINAKTKNELYNRAKQLNKDRLLTGKRQIYQGRERQTVINEAQKLRDEYEDQNLGGFKRIFPLKDEQKMKKYNNIINVATKAYFQENGSIRMKMMQKQAKKLIKADYKQMKKNKEKQETQQRENKSVKLQNNNNSSRQIQNKPKKLGDFSNSNAVRIISIQNKDDIEQQTQSKELDQINLTKSEIRIEYKLSQNDLKSKGNQNEIKMQINMKNSQPHSVEMNQRKDIYEQINQYSRKLSNKNNKNLQNALTNPEQLEIQKATHNNNNIKMRPKKMSSLKTNQELPNIIESIIESNNINTLIRNYEKSMLNKANKSQSKNRKIYDNSVQVKQMLDKKNGGYIMPKLMNLNLQSEKKYSENVQNIQNIRKGLILSYHYNE